MQTRNINLTALRALKQAEAENLAKVKALKAAIAEGMIGPFHDGPAAMAELRRNLVARAKQGKERR